MATVVCFYHKTNLFMPFFYKTTLGIFKFGQTYIRINYENKNDIISTRHFDGFLWVAVMQQGARDRPQAGEPDTRFPNVCHELPAV
jgi:hypothetical protein